VTVSPSWRRSLASGSMSRQPVPIVIDAREQLRRGSDNGEGPFWTLWGSLMALVVAVILVVVARLAIGLGDWAERAQEQTRCQTAAAMAAMETRTTIDTSACGAGGLPDLWELITDGGRS
jgi:hypothetical protein